MVTPGMTREELARDIQALSGAWSTGDPADTTLRATCLQRLTRLRQLYREQPGVFAAEQLSMLRAVAEGLRTPAVTPRGRHPRRPQGDVRVDRKSVV
jgi:hypothetical protein